MMGLNHLKRALPLLVRVLAITLTGMTAVVGIVEWKGRAWLRTLLLRHRLVPAVALGQPYMTRNSGGVLMATAAWGEEGTTGVSPSRTRKLLLVDDEEGVLALLAAILGTDQCNQVLLARDGLEAWEVARREKPDLVFLDIMMPLMDGYEVAKALKIDPATAHS